MHMEPLVQYIRDNALRQSTLAKQLGIADATLSNILKGKRRPGFALAMKIEQVTGIPRSTLRPDVYEAAQ
jgi:transcriptional regulator with XRE-family HTH domain